MTDDPPLAPAAEPHALPRGPRPLRRLEPPESPWPGVLANDSTGSACLLVDRDDLSGWGGWDAAPDGHVLGPQDVIRRADGHDVVMPLCVERVETFLDRRRAVAPLGVGETVTIAVSLLRGVVELQSRASSRTATVARGTWWLTDSARPVFVDGAGETASGAAERFFSASMADCPDLALLLERCVAHVGQPRSSPREASEIENELFARAAAEPLTTTVLSPARSRTSAVVMEPAPLARSARWREAFAGHIDASLADQIAITVSAVASAFRGRRRRERTGRRRRPLLIAAAVGGAVLVVGLLWPTGPHDRATADAPATRSAQHGTEPRASGSTREPLESTAAPRPVASPRQSTESAPLVEQTDQLLDAHLACRGRSECLSGIVEAPGHPFPRGAASASGSDRTLTLLDEFGGAAVLRAETRSGTLAAQYVVIVRENGRWLLRDVNNVAGQPSGRSG